MVGPQVRRDAKKPLPPLGDSGLLLASSVTSRGHTPAGRLGYFFSSRSSRRRILPTLVLGRSVRNSMYFGHL